MTSIFEKISHIKMYPVIFWVAAAVAFIFATSPFLGLSRDAASVYIFLVFYATILIWCIRSLHRKGVRLQDLLAFSTYSTRKLMYLLWPVPLGVFALALVILCIVGGAVWFPHWTMDLIRSAPVPMTTVTVFAVLKAIIAFTLAPVAEELLFRGIIFNKWACTMGVKKAIVASSVLFMLAHGVLNAWHLLLGFVLCILYLKTGGLWFPILVHMITNFVSKVPPLFSTASAPLQLEDLVAAAPAASIGLLISLPFVVWFFYRFWPQIPLKRA